MHHLPYLPDLTPRNFLFVSSEEKSPKGETVCQCGRGETKHGRSTKRHQNQQAQKLLSGEKCLYRCIASNGEYFEDD